MGYFATQLDSYAARYGLSPRDRRRVAMRWPLFKLFYWARSGPRWLRSVAMPLFRLFGRARLPHTLRAAWGGRVPFTLSFDEFDFATFREVLWGPEYDSPVDLSQARTYVDLGANTGIAAVRFLLAAPLQKIVLVEANPNLLTALRERIAGPLTAKTAVLEHAAVVGAKDHPTITFHVDANPRHGSARADAGGTPVEVRALRLRDLLDRHSLERVDILKVDIEGSEHDLLDNDPDVFSRCGTIFVEVHGDAARRDGFVRRLEELKFRVVRRSAEPGAPAESVVATRASA